MMDKLNNFKEIAEKELEDIVVSDDLKKRTILKCSAASQKRPKQIYAAVASIVLILTSFFAYNFINNSNLNKKTVAQHSDKSDPIVNSNNSFDKSNPGKEPNANEKNTTSNKSNNKDLEKDLKENKNNLPNNKINNSTTIAKNEPKPTGDTQNKPIEKNEKPVNQGGANSVKALVLSDSEKSALPTSLKEEITKYSNLKGYHSFTSSSFGINDGSKFILISCGDNSINDVFTSTIDYNKKIVNIIVSEGQLKEDSTNHKIIKITNSNFNVKIYTTKGLELLSN